MPDDLLSHDGPMMVAAITDPASLRFALKHPPAALDWFEIRADHWAEEVDTILPELPKLAKPLILTSRHPKEGGAGNLSAKVRRALFEEFLPFVHMVDIEARSLVEQGEVVEQLKQLKLPLIVSYHDFEATPSLSRMRSLAKSAKEADASIFKLAATPRGPAELARLVEFLDEKTRIPVAVMGMGPLGKLSRLLCASLGSILNYCYLEKPQVPGQWRADQLRERVAELAV